MKPETVYEVKGGANATLEWTPSLPEASARMENIARGTLYQINTTTGVKTVVRRKW